MDKYIVLSVDDNPEYLYYLPLTVWAWEQFGWWPIIFRSGESNKLTDYVYRFAFEESEGLVNVLAKNKDHKSHTLAQVSRLYGTCVTDGYLMTGDIDMVPLSDYWKPKADDITCYGRDLTDYHYPICYIGMDSMKWADVMNIKNDDYNSFIKRDLDSLPQSMSSDPSKVWCLDQDLITERLLQYGKEKITHIDRGTNTRTGYPLGRVDRSGWTLEHETLIDCHMYRGLYKTFTPNVTDTNRKQWADTMRLLEKVWPNENFDWFIDYTKQFAKLLS